MAGIYYDVEWDFKFVIVSLVVSFLGALVAVQLAEQRRRSVVAGKNMMAEVYLFAMAASIGIVAIWAMHFTGMMAMIIKLDGKAIEVSYDLNWTVFSMFAALLFVYSGLRVAMKDKFYSSINVTSTLAGDMANKSLAEMKNASTVKLAAFVSGLHWIVGGGILTAGGVGAMHFTGMVSQTFGAETEWDYGIVAAAMVIAIVAASAGFWIIFRFLAWKPNSDIVRIVAAVIISIAVNGMHYTGMMAAKYKVAADAKMSAQIKPVTALTLAIVMLILVCFPSLLLMISDLRKDIDNAPKGRGGSSEVTVTIVPSSKKKGATNLAIEI